MHYGIIFFWFYILCEQKKIAYHTRSYEVYKRKYRKNTSKNQIFPHCVGRTNSMGKLDPMGGGRSSGSQPCLMVAQTVSNRRKRHAQEQKVMAGVSSSMKQDIEGRAEGRVVGASGGQQAGRESSRESGRESGRDSCRDLGLEAGQPSRPRSRNSKKSFHRSESFQQQQQQSSHFFVNTQMDELPTGKLSKPALI